MHRALATHDIVDLICAEVGTNSLRSLEKNAMGDLSKLARTSKIFLDPSLNILWKFQDTIIPILRCMPDDLWDLTTTLDIEEMSDDSDTQILETPTITVDLRRPIVAADWERPLFYLHRVKSLVMTPQAFRQTSDIFGAFTLCPPGDYIFPNLEFLMWLPDSSVGFHHVRLFLTPRINNLTLASMTTIGDLCVLSNLAFSCPSLTGFKVYIREKDLWPVAIRSISTVVCQFTHLESLHIPGLNETALAHVAQLSGLQSLSFSTDEIPVHSLRSMRASDIFPSLTALTVPGMEHATSIISALGRCSFVELSCTSAGPQPTAISREFYSTLAKHCSHSSLREVSVEYDSSTDTMADLPTDQLHRHSVGIDILRPLLSFTQLVHVDLTHPVGFDLDDAALRDMARAWPRIKSLNLAAVPPHRIRPRATLESLRAFAAHCPRLCTLELTFNATVVPKIRLPGKKGVSQESLSFLNVAASPIKKSGRVAHFISAIFPGLRVVTTLYEDLMDDEDVEVTPDILTSHKMWKDVEDGLFDNE
ncbi:hypothetical protein B0H11DRAFT_1984854 [Mycena galericulata]|nr:hypothetical protein B0H11DRAFT_1984854 [Mycena galericulata]